MRNTKRKTWYAVVFLVVLMMPAAGLAEEDESASSGYTITVGISVKYLSLDLYVNEDINPQGTLTDGDYVTYFLMVGSPYRYVSENIPLGYYIEVGLSNFRMERQEIDEDLFDLGTSVRGHYLYVTPMGIFTIDHRLIEVLKGISFTLGLGVGVGYVSAKGDIILTGLPTQPRHTFDVNGVGFALSLMGGIRLGNLLCRVSAGGPWIKKDGIEYDIFDYSLDIGYVFTF